MTLRAEATVAPAVLEALRAAAERAGAEAERVAHHAGTPEELQAALEGLVREVHQVLQGAEPPAPGKGGHLARALLGLLRRALADELARLEPAPDGADVVRLLGALEAVGAAYEPDWSQHFADRLSGPDGLELVVEVAHDLRSPLTSILFLAETLQRGRSGTVSPMQERQLGLIYSAAFGLSSMASDVIELARGGDRLVDLDPIPFSISDILESVRDIVFPIAEEKGLEVRLVPPAQDFRVGHPVALSRVLLNLTTNALKFTSEGHVELSAAAQDGDAVVFAVQDTGRGIPEKAMATLFEPFRRRQRDGDYAFSGSGLGLSICRKLVEAMGSRLEVETSAGQGSRFHFTLVLPRGSLG